MKIHKRLAWLGFAALWLAVQPVAYSQTKDRATAPEDRILVQAWAEAETVISSPISGQILAVPTRVGTRFNKGEVLVRFNCTENQARAEIAQSELTAATEAMEAKIRLQGMNAASEIEVTTAAAQVAKAQAQLNLSKYQVGQCDIAAPFAGYVVRSQGKPYQTTTVGQPLIEIISAGVPKLKLIASSKLFTRLKAGTALRVTIDETGTAFNAVVSMVNARLDPVNQSFEMEGRIVGSAAGLLPGMSGTAVLTSVLPEPASAAALPKAKP